MNENPFSIEMQTVGITLWNPTNEKLDMQYAGISIGLEPGQKQMYHVKCAMHLLNAFGQRGLTSLPYGGDEDKISAEAVHRNLAFKKKQVVEYNQRNESRKAMNLGFLPPSEDIKKYALELGLKLLEPYTVRDEERAGIAKAGVENEELKQKLEAQSKEMAELKEMMKQLMPQEKSEARVKKDGKWVKE